MAIVSLSHAKKQKHHPEEQHDEGEKGQLRWDERSPDEKEDA